MAEATQIEHERAQQEGRGRRASGPLEVPLSGWLDVLRRVRIELKRDKCTLLAAGVAFYALIALVPTLAVVVSVYGLASDPEQVSQQVDGSLEAAPPEVRELVSTQLEAVSGSSDTGLSLGLVIGLIVAIWSASRAVNHLISAVNAAYDERDDRNIAKRRGLALVAMVGATLFLVTAFWVLALLPAALRIAGLEDEASTTISVLRWPLLAGGIFAGLCVLYRHAPDRVPPAWRWVTVGAAVAMVVWLAGSIGLTIYTSRFAELNETYGTIGAVVVLLIWLFLTAYAVLLGAEINAELEHQTAEDTTVGEPRPIGERGAVVADGVGAATFEEHHGTGTGIGV